MRKRGERGLSRISLRLLESAAVIAGKHGPISVRGVAYKLFVNRDIPSMGKKDVDKVGRLLVYAREHGIVDWDDIVDESRTAERPAAWDNLTDFSAAVARSYRRDFWGSLPYCLQVWSEKATVGGIIRPVTEQYGIPFLAVHGFGSATALHDAAIESSTDRREFIILYVGDFDPSGRHMSDVDLPVRLKRYGGAIEVRRIALNANDVRGLPSFKAKPADPRYKWYRAAFGEEAWELDALDPNILRQRVSDTILEYVDPAVWERLRTVEMAEKATVTRVAMAMAGASD